MGCVGVPHHKAGSPLGGCACHRVRLAPHAVQLRCQHQPGLVSHRCRLDLVVVANGFGTIVHTGGGHPACAVLIPSTCDGVGVLRVWCDLLESSARQGRLHMWFRKFGFPHLQ